MTGTQVIGGDLAPGTCLDCDGSGTTPIYHRDGDHPPTDDPMYARPADETSPAYLAKWRQAEATQPSRDGYHFVECECGVTP